MVSAPTSFSSIHTNFVSRYHYPRKPPSLRSHLSNIDSVDHPPHFLPCFGYKAFSRVSAVIFQIPARGVCKEIRFDNTTMFFDWQTKTSSRDLFGNVGSDHFTCYSLCSFLCLLLCTRPRMPMLSFLCNNMIQGRRHPFYRQCAIMFSFLSSFDTSQVALSFLLSY